MGSSLSGLSDGEWLQESSSALFLITGRYDIETFNCVKKSAQRACLGLSLCISEVFKVSVVDYEPHLTNTATPPNRS